MPTRRTAGTNPKKLNLAHRSAGNGYHKFASEEENVMQTEKKLRSHLGNASFRDIRRAIRQMSDAQRKFAAALLRSRQPIPEEALSRGDVLDALEMALATPPATPPERVPQELANLSPTYTAESRLSYGQYQTAKGWL